MGMLLQRGGNINVLGSSNHFPGTQGVSRQFHAYYGALHLQLLSITTRCCRIIKSLACYLWVSLTASNNGFSLAMQ